MLDYLIIGAGPAGLQLAYYLGKSNRNYLVIEKNGKAGSFFEKYPRHRTLISINKVYTGFDDPEVNMRWDWNSLLSDDPEMVMGKYTEDYFPSADYLVKYLADFASKNELKIQFNSEVVHVNKMDNVFTVKLANGEVMKTKRLVIGTGIFKPRVPDDVPGIELCENYNDHSIDLNEYKNKRVLVLGKGNSGFETCDHLVGAASLIHIASPNPLKFAWSTHFVGHLRAINNNFLDTYQLKSQNAVIDATIQSIVKKDGQLHATFNYSHANGEVETLVYDKIIVATGYQFDTSIFDESITPDLDINDRFPKQTSEWESTNIPDLYYIGAITQQRDFKKHTSAFIHGFRYNVQCLAKILEYKYQGEELPNEDLEYNTEVITNKLVEQINRTSALWQQFGFICDLLTVNPEKRTAKYYKSLPVDYIMDSDQWKDDHQFYLTLEYGDIAMEEDTFAVDRIRRDEVTDSKESKFLHPIVRHYHMGKLVSEHHMIEVLEAVWDNKNTHIDPLHDYIKGEVEAMSNSKEPSLT